MRRFLALVVVLLGIGGEAAAADTPTDVGTGFSQSNPAGQLSGLLVNLADNNTATTPAANRLSIKDNDTGLTPDPTCANAGVVGEITLLDVDETATDDWVICVGTAMAFDIPDTGSDIIANAQILVGTGAGTGAYVTVSGAVTISNAGATTLANNVVGTNNIVDGTALVTDMDRTYTLAADMSLGGASAVWFATTGLIWEGTVADTNEGLLRWPTITADRTLDLPDGDGTLCATNAVCSGYQATLTTGNLTATAPAVVSGSRQVIGGAADISLSGTAAQFNTAVSDDDFVTLAGTQEITGDKTFSGALVGTLTGNASTATAVVNNPDPCPANQYVSDISTLSDAATALTCSQIDVANATGTLGIGRLNANYGDFTCNGSTCTVGAVSSTTSATFTLDSDNGGSEPANGAGLVIEGGSGTNITATYDSTGNDLEFAGAAGGYTFDGPIHVTAADGSRGATFTDNTSEPSAPSSGSTLLYALGGEFYKKDNADSTNEKLILTHDNIIGDITCGTPASGQTSCTVGAAKLDLDNFVSSLTGSANFNTNDAELRIAATTTNPGAEGEVQWDSATNGLEGYSGGAVRTVAMTGLSQPVKFGTVEVGDGGGSYGAGTSNVLLISDAASMTDAASQYGPVFDNQTITLTADVSFASAGAYVGSQHAPTLTTNTATRNLGLFTMAGYQDATIFSPDTTGGAITGLQLASFQSAPTTSRAAGANGVTLTNLIQYNAGPPVIGANTTVTTRTGFAVQNVTPTGTLTTQIGLDIPALAGASSGAVPNNIGIRNASTEVFPPTTQVIAGATDTFACSATFRKFTTVTGTTVMTSSPTISNGATGQICILENVDATGTDCVTFPDGTTGLQLEAARTLCPNDTLTVIYDGTDWIEVATANN